MERSSKTFRYAPHTFNPDQVHILAREV
jgi:hypothetical protein